MILKDNKETLDHAVSTIMDQVNRLRDKELWENMP